MNNIVRAAHNAVAARLRSMIPEDHEFEGQGISRAQQEIARHEFVQITQRLADDLTRKALK